MMTPERLRELLARFPSKRLIVIGDYFLDKYLEFDPDLAETSLETGRTANQVVNVRHGPGAAGTVVSNLVALGAGEVIPIGFTGDDGEGYELRQDIQKLGCSTDHLLSVPNLRTPTYLKPRNSHIPGLEGESERYDIKNRVPLPTDVEKSIIDSLTDLLPGTDAVIIADQVEEENHGVITSNIRGKLAQLAEKHRNIVFWADSRCRMGCFRNVIVKPNECEAVQAAFPEHRDKITDEIVIQAGKILLERTGRPVFITCAERGILVISNNGVQEIRAVRIDSFIDSTGAGDSATAAAILALASGGSLAEAAVIANLTASITIKQLGTTGTATPDRIPVQLDLWHTQAGMDA